MFWQPCIGDGNSYIHNIDKIEPSKTQVFLGVLETIVGVCFCVVVWVLFIVFAIFCMTSFNLVITVGNSKKLPKNLSLT